METMTPDELILFEKQYDALVAQAPESIKPVLERMRDGCRGLMERAKQCFQGGIVGLDSQDEIPLGPEYVITAYMRYSTAPCGVRLLPRRGIYRMKHYYQRHIERHQCQPELPSDETWGHKII